MKSNQTTQGLPENVVRKLRAVRRRLIGFTLLEGVALSLAVLLAAILVAMIVDRMVGWFSAPVRYAFTLSALAAGAAAFVLWCVRPLTRKRSIVSTARQVDLSVPQLEERWSTVAELAQNNDAPEVRGSEAMISKVTAEAAEADNRVSPAGLVSSKPLFKAARWLAGAAAVLALLFAINFTQANLLWQRFWNPGEEISLTHVTASPSSHWVPKGEALTLQAALQGRVPDAPPKLFLRTESRQTSLAMTAQTGAADKFQHSIDAVTGSFSYRVRAGDGQTPWHEITAVDRPKITEVKLKVQPPSYSQLPTEENNSLPHAVRILDGSELTVSFRADQPLDRLTLDLGAGPMAPLAADQDNWYQFRIRPTNSFTFVAAAINKFQLECKSKPSCHVTVYEDLAPTVKILEPSDDIAVLPGEKVKVTFEATDDLGLATAEVVIATTKSDGTTNTITVPVPLGNEGDNTKQVQKTVELDTQALGLKHGDQLSYVVQVTDTKQTQSQGGAQPRDSASQMARGQPKDQASEASSGKQSQAEQALADSQNAEQASAESKSAEQASANSQQAEANSQQSQSASAASQKGEQTAANPSEPKASEQTAAAERAENEEEQTASANAASSQKANQAQAASEQRKAGGDRPPPNEMAKRSLDAGQSSACEPRNIKVDQWAGQFDGERREKLEIAIEPILKLLDQLWAEAQSKTEALKGPAPSAEGLQLEHTEPLAVATNKLHESEEAIADLNSRTKGTPYAFIGLQLKNIGQAHITPAQGNLMQVTVGAGSNNVARIDQASFHIARAREMLGDLTKTYQQVKRDQQVADAMQRLNKMYQIFLEDTQELLGNKPGPINSYQRKIAEVDEEYVKKLKELLEEKKKIMAELAKVLADDPRMLRRYLAMMEQQSTSLRDQLTLLTERQKQIQEQVAAWNTSPEADRPTLIQQFQESYRAQQLQLARDAAKLRENMETWLPLDVQPEQVSPVLVQAEKVVQHLSEGPSTNAQEQALTDLRELRDGLPGLNQIQSTNSARMASYIANRLVEVESLITAQSGQMKIAESFEQGDFPKVAEVVQHRLTQDTVALGEKLDATEKQVASMSAEIAEKAEQLNKTVQTDIVLPQEKSIDHLAAREVSPASELLDRVVPAFGAAEQTFDELLRLIIAKMDEAPPPTDPGEAQSMESLMTLLEDEQKATEGLGIPCRPLNVSVQKDWMKPGSGSAQGMGQAQAQAAQAQAQQAQAETERMEKEARQSAKRALTQAREESQEVSAAAAANGRGEGWNKLVSKLGKDLLQGRDNTPPEQYRAAIENYFKTISDTAPKE